VNLRPQMAVAVKQPRTTEELHVDHSWLQQLQGFACVPRLHGTCTDQDNRQCIITSPVGEQLSWRLWDRCSRNRPLHSLLGPLVQGVRAVHEHGVVIRDLRPANLVLAGARLLIVDWGSAVNAGGGPQRYSGASSYASDSVLVQLAEPGAQPVLVTAADDLVTLVRGMFALRHPMCAVELSWQMEALEHKRFWEEIMAVYPAWKSVQDAAVAERYDAVAAELEVLMQ
jgi:serine/threonine protein kinase